MQYQDPRAAEARRLRTEEGLSSKQIRERLGVDKNRLQYWLAGLSTSQGLRPNARDDLKAEARRMRTDGHSYSEIVAAIGASQSSVSLWVRDIPVSDPEVSPGWTESARLRRATNLAAKHARRDAARLAAQQELRQELGPFDKRDVLIAGAIAYWCEGAKVKPWRPNDAQVVFTNTDPRLIRTFLDYLAVVPVKHGGPVFYVHIHETADDESAKQFWCAQLGIDPSDFLRTLWKRHNPKTVRKNVSTDYHGCLVVRVRKARELYWYTENLAKAVMAGMSDAGLE